MTLTLILTRHAKSSWGDADLEDHARPLNKRGRASAKAIGRWIADHGITPQEVLCSDANFELILKAAEQFPPLWLGMLEVRLVDDPAAAGVDFGVLLYRERQHFEKILGHYPDREEIVYEW